MMERKGFYIDHEGYIRVIKPKGHPYKGRYVFLHRLLMEKKIGRYLTAVERVHHKDGNRQNNAEDNLELFGNQSEHAKQGAINSRIYKQLWDKEWMIREYLDKERACSDIAKEIGCREGTVRNALIQLKIPRRRYTLTEESMMPRRKGAKTRAGQLRKK